MARWEVRSAPVEDWPRFSRERQDKFANAMVPTFVEASLDPSNDKKVSREELSTRIMSVLPFEK